MVLHKKGSDSLILNDGQDITVTEDDIILAVQFDFAAGVFSKDNSFANLDFRSNAGAIIKETARTYSYDFTGLGFVLMSRIGQINPAFRFFLPAQPVLRRHDLPKVLTCL